MDFQELELKYYVLDLDRIEAKLKELGAACYQQRILEKNLRFDTPDRALTREGKVLRLRYDTEVRITYKGPSQAREGIRLREEIEFVADNYEAARAFLLALGYQVSVFYEKYRTVYLLGEVHIMLDELPYGNFVEIEGPDPASIQAINSGLGLNWETRIPESYTMLFDRLHEVRKLPFRDLSFDNFIDLHVNAADLQVLPADR
ncbi:MAG: putative adenylate cyclase [Chloroflexi bacterium]|jgi:adenylate cyclase class 2|nr:putative adenylate cyclase [Chloroflexota bacterium]